MKRHIACACLTALLAISAGPAAADSIKGKLGATGRLGFLIPADSERINGTTTYSLGTDATFIGGGGLIYGIDDHLAADLELTYANYDSDIAGIKIGDNTTVNVSLGIQYRFNPEQKIVPFVGAGLDILVNDFTETNGTKNDVDTVLGIHGKVGVDYFINRQLAVTGELKVILAPDADMKSNNIKTGNIDPSSFAGTVGVRYFFF